jgi:putative permease
MIDLFKSWYYRNFSDPQAVILAMLLVVGFVVVIFFGNMLAPLLASVVIAYLLEGVVGYLQRRSVPRFWAVNSVFLIFLALSVFIILGLIPLLSQQLSQFFNELPNMVMRGQKALLDLQENYPSYFTGEQVRELMSGIRSDLASMGQNILSKSIASIPAIITVLVYLILVPLLVFFFLKDKDSIVKWVTHYLPDDRKLATRVWHEMDQQIGNYVRGKFLEIVIVSIATYVVFAFMGLNYAPLLAVLVGISVLVPYIGAAVVTIPVAMVGYFQWGWSAEFGYIMLAYGIIQALDGNVLVPLLFSEAVNLHPVAIIVAVLVFGGMWGFWGVFFAIPLATLVKAVLNAWPRVPKEPKAKQTA